MEINFGYRNKVFILGAGASKDYGLPIWKELDSLIRDNLKNEEGNKYSRSKDILAWLDKVGEKKEYKTIDECVEKESVSGIYHSDGDSVENDLFLSVKDVFNGVYKENNEGWIKKLNDKILRHPTNRLEEEIAFISYNYDNILEKNLLKFGHLPGKHSRLNVKPRLDQLSATALMPVLYGHGNLYMESEVPQDSHTKRYYKTMKSGIDGYVDVVSCYEGHNHTVAHNSYSGELELYILGLGGGLKFNLNKLTLHKKVSKIFVTVSDHNNDEDITNFLSTKFKISSERISIYRTCIDLVEDCFQ